MRSNPSPHYVTFLSSQEAVQINVSSVQTIYGQPTCMSRVSRHLIPNSALEAHEDRHSVRNTGGVVNEEDCTWTGKENLTSYLLEEYFKTLMANQKDELR